MNDIYGVFKDHVTAIRGGKLKKPIDELAAGRMFTGRQALDLGLVDRIGTLDDAITFAADQAKVTDYTVRTIPEPKNFLQKLMEQSAGSDDDTVMSCGSAASSIGKLAEPYLAGLDPDHARIVPDGAGTARDDPAGAGDGHDAGRAVRETDSAAWGELELGGEGRLPQRSGRRRVVDELPHPGVILDAGIKR